MHLRGGQLVLHKRMQQRHWLRVAVGVFYVVLEVLGLLVTHVRLQRAPAVGARAPAKEASVLQGVQVSDVHSGAGERAEHKARGHQAPCF